MHGIYQFTVDLHNYSKLAHAKNMKILLTDSKPCFISVAADGHVEIADYTAAAAFVAAVAVGAALVAGRPRMRKRIKWRSRFDQPKQLIDMKNTNLRSMNS